MNEESRQEAIRLALEPTDPVQLTSAELKERLLAAIASRKQFIAEISALAREQGKQEVVLGPHEIAAYHAEKAAGLAWTTALTREYKTGKEDPVKPGEYKVRVCFPHKSGKDEERTTLPITMSEKSSLADLKMQALHMVQMEGLHNFRLKFDESETATVNVTATNMEDPTNTYQFTCAISLGGHIVGEHNRPALWR